MPKCQICGKKRLFLRLTNGLCANCRSVSPHTPTLDALLYEKTLDSASLLETDLVIMDVHGSVCPECAKYQGRVYSISGKSDLFPKVPDFFHSGYAVHPGCSHTFSPYIHGVDDPDLAYTLLVHPLKDPQYGSDIVTFSNRPFADDRIVPLSTGAKK